MIFLKIAFFFKPGKPGEPGARKRLFWTILEPGGPGGARRSQEDQEDQEEPGEPGKAILGYLGCPPVKEKISGGRGGELFPGSQIFSQAPSYFEHSQKDLEGGVPAKKI